MLETYRNDMENRIHIVRTKFRANFELPERVTRSVCIDSVGSVSGGFVTDRPLTFLLRQA